MSLSLRRKNRGSGAGGSIWNNTTLAFKSEPHGEWKRKSNQHRCGIWRSRNSTHFKSINQSINRSNESWSNLIRFPEKNFRTYRTGTIFLLKKNDALDLKFEWHRRGVLEKKQKRKNKEKEEKTALRLLPSLRRRGAVNGKQNANSLENANDTADLSLIQQQWLP